jgi:hypothetical protein
MKLCRVPEGRYWFPDAALPRVASAIAGPFDTNAAAYGWLIFHLEDKLSPPRKALWQLACDQLGTAPDVAQLMGLIMGIASGQGEAWVRLAAQPITRERVDRRMLAAGERAA